MARYVLSACSIFLLILLCFSSGVPLGKHIEQSLPPPKSNANPLNNHEAMQNDIRDFLELFSWIREESSATDGSLYAVSFSPQDSDVLINHVLEITLSILDPKGGLAIVEAPGQVSANSTPNVWNLFFGVTNDTKLLISTDADFRDSHIYSVGQEIVLYRKDYYLSNLNTTLVTISYAGWQTNYPALISLLRIYHATGNTTFLEQCVPYVNHFLEHRDSEGLWSRRYVPEEDLVYQGMFSAIPMHGLYKYYLATANETVYSVLQKAANNYIHTTEGTTNHAANSVMGLVLSNIVLGKSDFSWAHRNLDYLLGLYEEDGKISYTMNPGPSFPMYKPSYWSYDLKVFMRIAEMRFHSKIEEALFPVPYKKALNASSGIQQRVHLLNAISVAIEHGHDELMQNFTHVSDEVCSVNRSDFSSIFDALAQLESYSLKIALRNSKPQIAYISETGATFDGGQHTRTIKIRFSRQLSHDCIAVAIISCSGHESQYAFRAMDEFTFSTVIITPAQSSPELAILLISNGTSSFLGPKFTIYLVPIESTGLTVMVIASFILLSPIPILLLLIAEIRSNSECRS